MEQPGQQLNQLRADVAPTFIVTRSAANAQGQLAPPLTPMLFNGIDLSNFLKSTETKPTTLVEVMKQRPLGDWRDTVFKDAEADLTYIGSKLQGQKFYPPVEEVFRAFELTPLARVRVVIIGQDPYPGVGRRSGLPNATGLAFSTRAQEAIPDSLENIYKELVTDLAPNFVMPSHGDLTYWAVQGVLLLNQTLTVIPNHADDAAMRTYWKSFIRRTLHRIQNDHPDAIFVLWGNRAKELASKEGIIFRRKYIIEGAHPSPLSAKKGFFGGRYFSRINEILVGLGQAPIDWQISG